MKATVGADAPSALAVRTRKHITRRLIPFLFLLYIVSYLDRVNLSYAGLEMTKELHFSNEVYGLGSGIFFLGYVLLEVPGTLLVELWSARKWISRILVTWGIVAALTGLIHTKPEFYWARFLLGVAEAGFFPGVIVYLSHWFRAADRAKAVAMFMAAIPVSQFVGAPVSALCMKIHWLGYGGWRWLLILEGLPAVILGVVTLFYLTDRPKDARWLADDEREWITAELDRERAAITAREKVSFWRAFWHRDVIILTLVYFLGTQTSYGFSLWLPKMMQNLSGYSPIVVSLLSAIPFLATWPFMLFMGWSSDRMGERRLHTSASLVLAAIGLGLSRLTGNVAVGVFAFTLAAMGINGRLPPFWAMPGEFLAGTSAAAIVGTINCVGQIGGFFGPYLVGWLTDKTGTYAAGVFFLLGSALAGAALVLLVKRRNAP